MRLLFAALVLISVVPAQEPLIKTTTRLVQVSVVAKSHDQPAAGLTVDDFKVLVDGHAQKVSFFSALANSDHPAPAAPIAPNTYTNITAVNGQGMNGVTVVLLDLENTKFKDRLFAQQQLIKYLLSIPASDRVAVYTFNGRLKVLHDYTSSMEAFQQRLVAAKGTLVSVTNVDDGGPINSSSDGGSFIDVMGGGGGAAERSFYLRNRVVGTLNVLKFIAAHLAEVPGRKNLVWLSEGFPLQFGYERMSNFSEEFSDEMDATVRALSDANVAVYPVDARGLTTPATGRALSDANSAANPVDARDLTTPALFDASRGGGGGVMRTASGNPKAPPKPIPGRGQIDSHGTMDELAHRTGGHAYYNTNDLSKAIHEAVEDSTLTYTLGFYPEDEKHNREFHKLKVEVSKPHINLSYRSGYLDLAEVPKDEKTRSVQVHDALWSPLDATELGISVKLSHPVASAAVLLGQAAPPPTNSVNVAVTLDSKGVQVQPKNNRYSGRIDFLMVQFDKDGKPIDLATNAPMQSVELNMLEPTFRKFLDEGLNVNQTLSLNPRTATVRVIVRDYGSGMIGSVTVPLKGNV